MYFLTSDFKKKKCYLFIYFWINWVFAAARAFLWLRRAGAALYSWYSGLFTVLASLVVELWGAQASVVAAPKV